MKRGLDLRAAFALPRGPRLRRGRSRSCPTVFALAVVVQLAGCAERYERPSDKIASRDAIVRISELVVRGKVHLDPTTLRPFSGWVYAVYSEEGLPEAPPVLMLSLRGRLEAGLPDGTFEFFDPQGRLIWEGSGYTGGSACGPWTFATHPEDAPGDGFEERWFSWVAPGLAPDVPAGDGTAYPPCPEPPINPIMADLPGSRPMPPWEARR